MKAKIQFNKLTRISYDSKKIGNSFGLLNNECNDCLIDAIISTEKSTERFKVFESCGKYDSVYIIYWYTNDGNPVSNKIPEKTLVDVAHYEFDPESGYYEIIPYDEDMLSKMYSNLGMTEEQLLLCFHELCSEHI